ncbi:NUDIX domain-containing protein [Allosphingosinicella vermicomposti]|uniref:NUDIX domain-containing protein n=1 Tax=Allosphingosinicella vermicomposti TaxID=614671 RepID=UPI000D10786B|nr:NUDIX domain-containing protein [Allosphingosinicella vermicomposti]
MDDLPPPMPAATLILMKEIPGQAPHVLFMERAATMAFAAGALVFPGGRVDEDDQLLAHRLAPELDHTAGRIAAIRETIEETGLVAGVKGVEEASAIRAALQGGMLFSQAIERFGLSFDLTALTPFARWCPNFKETRRFDTLFFLAKAPEASIATADRNEAVRTFWASAQAVLDDADAGRAHIIFPTRRNLERLARFASIAEARDDALRHPVQKVTPWIEERDGRPHLCIPDGIGYPVTAEPMETARRG